jgi:hypothetical protein
VTPQELEEDPALAVSAFSARRAGLVGAPLAATLVATLVVGGGGGVLDEAGRAVATVVLFGLLALAGADYALTGGAAVEALSAVLLPGAFALGSEPSVVAALPSCSLVQAPRSPILLRRVARWEGYSSSI